MQVRNISDNSYFGMRKIPSIRHFAKEHPDKVKTINAKTLKEANRTINEVLKGSKKERFKAKESASKAILTK